MKLCATTLQSKDEKVFQHLVHLPFSKCFDLGSASGYYGDSHLMEALDINTQHQKGRAMEEAIRHLILHQINGCHIQHCKSMGLNQFSNSNSQHHSSMCLNPRSSLYGRITQLSVRNRIPTKRRKSLYKSQDKG